MSLIRFCLFVVGIQVELDAVDVYLALPASVFPVCLQDQAVHQEIICIQRLRVRLLCDLGGWTREAREAFLMRWWFRERSGSANCALDIFRKDSVSSGQRKRQLGFTP